MNCLPMLLAKLLTESLCKHLLVARNSPVAYFQQGIKVYGCERLV